MFFILFQPHANNRKSRKTFRLSSQKCMCVLNINSVLPTIENCLVFHNPCFSYPLSRQGPFVVWKFSSSQCSESISTICQNLTEIQIDNVTLSLLNLGWNLKIWLAYCWCLYFLLPRTSVTGLVVEMMCACDDPVCSNPTHASLLCKL